MGIYCCCGTETGDCFCNWDGWIKVRDKLPDQNGLYMTRVIDNSLDCFEQLQKFTIIPRLSRGYSYSDINKIYWENEVWDDHFVYAWKENV